ncbi:MAG: Integral membrane sensor signal transduction histidine kinase [Microgenomates group bacterium GW2011_GWC1_43_11]|nr:MAG: Integral membrane sensor signal transduction histidine kinase [Microgenomates group bacterium GW2011_GWC1_43_11]
MNTKSLRFRLTAIYSSTLIFSLVILFASFYWVTKRELYNHTDTALRSHGNRIINILTQEQFLINKQMSSQLLTEVFNETPGMLAFVTDNQGNVLTVSQQVGNIDDVIEKLFTQVKTSKDSVFVNQSVGSLSMRFVLIPMISNGSLRDVIIIGHPIDVIDKSLGSLYGSLTLVFFSFVIPTVLGGYILAGSAMHPVEEISKEMAKISSENLKRRVNIPQTHDEIANLARTCNGLLDRLEEAFTRERQFIGDIAHELKTPLATLKGAIEVAKTKKRTIGEYQRVLEELLVDADRLSQTLTNVLDLAWSKSDTYENLKDTTNVTEVMHELTEVAQKLVYVKHISVNAHIEKHLVIRGKKDKLFRAMLNIIDNAVKYTKTNGTITLSLRSHTDQAIVAIKDTGIGIARADLTHIFDRYYRGSKTDTTAGSGLGLSIAHAVITSSGGTIGVKSSIGRGTTFTVVFPLESAS